MKKKYYKKKDYSIINIVKNKFYFTNLILIYTLCCREGHNKEKLFMNGRNRRKKEKENYKSYDKRLGNHISIMKN